jgi:outer membrane protein assembly factor BamB
MAHLIGVAVLCSLLLTITAHPAWSVGGDLLWQDHFDLAGGDDQATAIAAAGGRVVVVGTALNAVGRGVFVVVAYDAKRGALLWQDELDLAAGADDGVQVVMNNNHVVVAGAGVGPAGARLGRIRSYSAKTGEQLWQDSWPMSAGGIFFRRGDLYLAISNRHVFVAGTVLDTTGGRALRVRSYVTKSGTLVWEDQSEAPPGFTDPIGGAISVRGGRAFIAASVAEVSATSSPPSQCLVRAYEVRHGDLLWQATQPVATFCLPIDIGTDGRTVAISGIGGLGSDSFIVQAYDAETGALLWQTRNFGSPTQDALVAVDAARRQVVTTGWFFTFLPPGLGHREVFTVRSYDTETGELRWVTDFLEDPDQPGGDLWHGSDVDIAGGRVIAVGYKSVPAGPWLVRSLDLTDGRVIWEDRFEPVGPAFSFVYDVRLTVAVDGGRAFVAGAGRNALGDIDLILRAYDAK